MKIESSLIESLLLKIIRIGLALTLFTPLFFGPFGLKVIAWPQAIFFRLIIGVIFIFYIFLLLLNKNYLPRVSVLLISILIFDIILVISSIFGINFYRSFWGTMERGEGIITHLHLLAFFVILIATLKERDEWIDLFKISVWVSAISSFAAILQQFKIAPFYTLALDMPRVSGTLANPEIFASYISLSIFISILLFIIEQNKILKITWALIATLNCYTLFFSGTRGSILGVILGFTIILFYMIFSLRNKKRLLVLTVILFLCALALMMFLNIGLIKNLPGGFVFERFTQIDLSSRVDAWKAATTAFMARPLTGWGSESFTYIADKNMTSALVKNNYYDRPHNKILELLSCNGILGLLCYASIFFFIFYLVFRRKQSAKNNNDSVITSCKLILPSFFICCFIQNLFVFDSIGTYILFFLITSFINNNFSCTEMIKIEKDCPSRKNNKIYSTKVILAVIIVFLTIKTMNEINIKPTAAAMLFSFAQRNEMSRTKDTFKSYEQAIEMNTIYDTDLKMAFVDRSLYLLESGYANDFKKEIIDKLISIKPLLYDNIKSKYEFVNYSYQYLARINEQAYLLYKNKNYLNEMEEALRNGLSFNSNFSTYYHFNGELKILQNNYKEGELYIKKGCLLDDCPEAEMYRKIGNIYNQKGDKKNAIENFQKTLDIYYDYENQKNLYSGRYARNIEDIIRFMNYVGTTYCQELNDLKNCKNVYEKGIEAFPKYTDIIKKRMDILKLK